MHSVVCPMCFTIHIVTESAYIYSSKKGQLVRRHRKVFSSLHRPRKKQLIRSTMNNTKNNDSSMYCSFAHTCCDTALQCTLIQRLKKPFIAIFFICCQTKIAHLIFYISGILGIYLFVLFSLLTSFLICHLIMPEITQNKSSFMSIYRILRVMHIGIEIHFQVYRQSDSILRKNFLMNIIIKFDNCLNISFCWISSQYSQNASFIPVQNECFGNKMGKVLRASVHSQLVQSLLSCNVYKYIQGSSYKLTNTSYYRENERQCIVLKHQQKMIPTM